jgi:hypothetical protein
VSAAQILYLPRNVDAIPGAPFLEAAGGHTFLAGGLADLVEH